MRVTINIAEQVVYMVGDPHYLTRTGVQRVFVWLMDNAVLAWGWDSGEYVFKVNHATN